MQSAAWLPSVLVHLRAMLGSIVFQLTDWSDRVYWSGYGPQVEVALLIAAVAAVALCLFACTDERDVEIWSSPTMAGRWMGGLVAVAVVLVVGAGRFIGA